MGDASPTLRTIVGLPAAVLAALLAAGCEPPANSPISGPPKDDHQQATGNGGSAKSDQPASTDAAGKITVETTDADGLQKVLDRLRDEKKAVLVDFWGTWCDPCKKRFPHTVELAGAHAREGLAVVSVALEDDPARSKDEVVKFLTIQKATFTNLLSDASLEESISTFGIDGSGLPHFRVYGRDGTLLKKFITDGSPDTSFSDADIVAAVKAALAP